jgi:RadC-like JAB domain
MLPTVESANRSVNGSPATPEPAHVAQNTLLPHSACYNAGMRHPDRYQLAFDFGGPPEPEPKRHLYTIPAGGLTDLNPREPDLGRFVRAVQEEVIVRSPSDAARHLLDRVYTPFDDFDQEELWTLLLNTKNRITHEAMVYRGTVNTIYIRPAELFKAAVRVNAPALLLSHVHPSGSVEPSPEDIRLTADAYQAGQILGIDVLDHIIVGRDIWASLRERKLGFEK